MAFHARAAEGENLSAMTVGTEHRYIVRDDDILGGAYFAQRHDAPCSGLKSIYTNGSPPLKSGSVNSAN